MVIWGDTPAGVSPVLLWGCLLHALLVVWWLCAAWCGLLGMSALFGSGLLGMYVLSCGSLMGKQLARDKYQEKADLGNELASHMLENSL